MRHTSLYAKVLGTTADCQELGTRVSHNLYASPSDNEESLPCYQQEKSREASLVAAKIISAIQNLFLLADSRPSSITLVSGLVLPLWAMQAFSTGRVSLDQLKPRLATPRSFQPALDSRFSDL